jgi:3-hydroxybutyryl-CoA dehydrogenase
MKVEDVRSVGVVGCGTMGSTIVAAVALKYNTVVCGRTLKGALERVSHCFPTLVRKGKITEDEKQVCLSRISMSTELEALRNCQVVIIAVPDELELQCQIAATLNKTCSPEAVFMNATSLAIITAQGAASGRPDKVIGTHFCIPAHLMALVEVFPGFATAEETVSFTLQWLRTLEKVPIKCKEFPGLILNNLLIPFLNRAVRLVESGMATAEDIDTAVKLGLGHAMGPLELLDMSGIDKSPRFRSILFQETGDQAYVCPPLLKRMAEAGYWGRETRKGFYKYDEQGKKIVRSP